MKNTPRFFATVGIAMLSVLDPAWALGPQGPVGGLIQRAPGVGKWVRFKFTSHAQLPYDLGGRTKGSITLLSVGNSEVAGKSGHWIELTRKMEQDEAAPVTYRLFAREDAGGRLRSDSPDLVYVKDGDGPVRKLLTADERDELGFYLRVLASECKREGEREVLSEVVFWLS